MNPNKIPHDLGQVLWLDDITRELLNAGTLKRYIDELPVTGCTSNPIISDHAIKNSAMYDVDIACKVCPGWIRTPLVEQQIADMATLKRIKLEDAAKELLHEKQSSRAFATPKQLGGTVVFLCSDAAHQITGTTISIDGGWTAQ